LRFDLEGRIMALTTNEIRAGNKIEIEGEPYVIVGNEFVKPGKGRAFNRIRMENMKTGRVVEHTYTSGEKFDEADIEEKPMSYSYKDGTDFVFMDMDPDSYEQITLNNELVGPIEKWLKEEALYHILFFKGAVIKVSPPTFLELVITETSGGIRGDTSGRALKPCIVETGAEVYIPLFINQGDKIKVDTRTGEYVARVND
jgi:elongation factor P